MKNKMDFEVLSKDGTVSKKTFDVKRIYMGIAGLRETGKVIENLKKAAGNGYKVFAPHSLCMKSRYLLTNEDEIEVQGRLSTGEVEYVVMISDGDVLISAGSDHNDATLTGGMWSQALGKVIDVGKSKQACPAVIAKQAWIYDDVKDHWDDLRLKAWLTVDGKKIPYQDFPLSDLVDVEYYLKEKPFIRESGTVLFSASSWELGSIPDRLYKVDRSDGIFPNNFHFELSDPVLDRSITHGYSIISLPELELKCRP